ncbi:hypothetical protein B0T19DRAFT_396142 [Cercophora scortea]|uniref:J domain-containing protein n=1 Tax=Cercophora scortea TaxID=314031 RepID=A0AAE0J4H4_9PEZI|nr:hypothetical protein B0T19DRAFT_396142 [Cercophora scortea]
MADPGQRGLAGARRVPSAALDDYAFFNPGPGSHAAPSINYTHGSLGSHPLRAVESRFSLREQFAVTRREIDFDVDDASSILERSTLASQAGPDNGQDENAFPAGSFPHKPLPRDLYEVLCLPREPSLSPDDIRRAFHRAVQVLCVERQPVRLQHTAASYLGLVQLAFETLIEPYRRVEYDLSEASSEADPNYADVVDEPSSVDNAYGTALEEQYLLQREEAVRTTTDLGLRLDAVSALDLTRRPRRNGQTPGLGLGILDFGLRQSITVDTPALRTPIEKAASFVQGIVKQESSRIASKSSIRCANPTLNLTGSTHGLLDDSFKLATLLHDQYQPPGPSIHGRRRLEQLVASRFLGVLNVTARQELSWHEPQPQVPSRRVLPDAVIEQEVEILPQPSVTVRVGHSLDFPGDQEPLHIELSAQKLVRDRHALAPSLGLALSQRSGPGTAFLVADAGDWNFWPSKECRELSRFSKVTGGFAPRIDPFQNPPTIEAGYAFGNHEMGIQSGHAFTKPADRGLRGVDYEMNDGKTGSWTISSGLTSGNAAAYLRYGRDIFTSLTTSQSSNLPPGNSSHKRSGLRAEVEFAGTTQRDLFLAFRALKRVGRFAKVGLEVGLTPNNLHLSFYWSRLGQRVSVPFLIATKPSLSTKLAFWSTVVPFAALAALELLYWRPRSRKGATKKGSRSSTTKKEDMQDYIARRRTEADDLTVILATGVEPRQKLERQRGGLVILSAKYGVHDAPPDEIADVTIAVAACVDGGELLIPGGLRKSRLFGFWDPSPGSRKVLRVRFSYRGKEQTVEVSGRDELRLP